MKKLPLLSLALSFSLLRVSTAGAVDPNAAVKDLGPKFAAEASKRLERGAAQVATLWRDADGDQAAYEKFLEENVAKDQAELDTAFSRYEKVLEAVDGHLNEITLALREQADLDLGPVKTYDEIFAGYEPGAHINEDFFQNKAAFVVLANFPLTTLQQRLTDGKAWSRRQWAEARLAQRFSKRIPAEVLQDIAEASAKGERYIADYNIWMGHVLDKDGKTLFKPDLRLLSHWNLRDEIKAQYSEGAAGLPRQRLIQAVMERIVEQTIPADAVNNPKVDWSPYKPAEKPEPDTRYAILLANFRANKKADAYSPTAPTLMARSFDEGREIPEERVKEMFEQVLTSPLVGRAAKLIKKRLGRPLEPFDIWYNGFRPRGAYTEAQLDEITKKRYPTPQAYRDDIPSILGKLGFPAETAKMLASRIVVDPARGSGHAWGPQMRAAPAHLRTRVEKDGMNYKGYNIAVHEMGHNVEEVFSLGFVDSTLLAGVPNTAFTEALAMLLQNHDLELLGLAKPSAENEALEVLNDFWGAYEIAGVGLVDAAAWHWMYEHPEATAAELKAAVLQIAKATWNKYYAPVFGQKDSPLLGIYSHMIERQLYLPNYPLGHLIGLQIAEQMRKKGAIGPEFERMARFGSLAPDLWMINAAGAPVGSEGMLAATRRALAVIRD